MVLEGNDSFVAEANGLSISSNGGIVEFTGFTCVDFTVSVMVATSQLYLRRQREEKLSRISGSKKGMGTCGRSYLCEHADNHVNR